MVKCLEAEGWTSFLAIRGCHLPFLRRPVRFPIRHVLVRSEQNAAHMASGYARASG